MYLVCTYFLTVPIWPSFSPFFQMFRVLRESQPRFNEKLIVVHGDLSEDDFGLHGESLRRVTLDVSVVFHVAATVRFDEPLRLFIMVTLLINPHSSSAFSDLLCSSILPQ